MAETDIELKVGLDNKDAVQRSKELQNEIQRTFNKIDTSKMNASTKASINRLNKLSEKASEIQKKMEALSGDAINTEEYHKLQEELEKANTNFDHALDRQEALEQSGHATTEQITAARAETDRWAETIGSLQERMSALESSSGGLKENVPTAEYKELQDELEKLNTSFDAALDKQQALEESEWGHPDQIKAAREETDKWADSIEEVRQKMAAMEEAGTAYEAPKGASEEYSKLESQLEDVNNQMDVQLTRQQQMEDGFRRLRINSNNAFGRIFNQFSDGAYQFHRMAQGIQNIGPAIQGAMSGATTGFTAFNSIAGAALPIIGGITTGVGLLVTVVSKLVEAIHKAVQAMVEAIGKLEKKLVNSVPILKQIVGMITNPKETIQRLKQLATQIGGLLKRILSSVTGVLKNGISRAVGSIKSSIKEGIGVLEQWQIAMGNTSNSISALRGSLDLLKMNIGAAFAPILDAAAPVLLQLISILNQATIAIGSFFAALGGKTKILVAKSATASLTNASTAAGDVANAAEDSTDSLGNSYQALEKVGEGAEKAGGQLQDFLGSYDELNVIGKESGGGGGAGGGADLSANFEEIEIGQDILDLVAMIRDAWENGGDFTELGRLIGQKLLGVLQTADDWINQKGKFYAEKIGRSLATLLNGIFSTPGLGTQLGTTVSDAVDMVLKGIKSFLKNFNEVGAARFLVDAICGILDNKEMWDDLGDTIILGINKAISFVNEFLDPKNEVFTKLGNNIHDIIRKAVVGENGEGSIDFTGLGTVIARGIQAQLDLIYSTLEDRGMFYNLGTDLGGSLNAMQNEMTKNGTWAKLGKTLSNGFMDAFLVVGGFLDTWHSEDLSNGLATTIDTAVKDVNMEYVTSTMYRLSETLLKTLSDTIKAVPTETLSTALADTIRGMDLSGQAVAFNEFSHTLVHKLLDTTATAMKDLRNSGEFAKMGMEFADSLTAVDWSDVLGKFFENLHQLMQSGIELIGGFIAQSFINMIHRTVNQMIDGLLFLLPEEVRDGIKEHFNGVFEDVSNSLKPKAEDAADVIASGMSDGLTNGLEERLHAWPNTPVEQRLVEAQQIVRDAQERGEEIGNSYVGGMIHATTESLKAWPNPVTDKIDEGNKQVKTQFEDLNNEVSTPLNDFQNKVVDAFTNASSDAQAQVGSLNTETTSNFTNMRDTVVGQDGNGGILNTFINAVTGGFDTTKKSATDNASELSTNVKQSMTDLKDNTVGDSGTFTTFKNKASEIAADLNKDVTKEVQDMSKKVDIYAGTDIKNSVVPAFEETKNKVVGSGTTDTSASVPNITETTNDCFDELKEKLVGTAGLVPEIKNKTEEAFTQMKNKLVGTTGNGGLANDIKNGIINAFRNTRISLQSEYASALSDLQSYVNSSISSINSLIRAYEALARAKAEAGGGGVGSVLAGAFAKVPKLATGAVIPPNQPFLAMLGDQSNGTNVEAPLSTIQQAVANVLEPYLVEIANNTAKTAEKDLTVRIGDRDIARSATRGQKMMGLKIRTV